MFSNGWNQPLAPLTPFGTQPGSVGFGWTAPMTGLQQQQHNNNNNRNARNEPTKAQMVAKIAELENAILRMNAEMAGIRTLLDTRMDTSH